LSIFPDSIATTGVARLAMMSVAWWLLVWSPPCARYAFHESEKLNAAVDREDTPAVRRVGDDRLHCDKRPQRGREGTARLDEICVRDSELLLEPGERAATLRLLIDDRLEMITVDVL
jgi:hypothetical protein